MSATLPEAWFNRRPVAVFMIVFYCVMVALQTGSYMVHEGYSLVRQGDASIFSMLGYCLCSLLILIGGLQLWAKKPFCRVAFAVALILGVALRTAQLGAPYLMTIMAAPLLKEYALVFGMLVYSLQLGSQGYFAARQ